MGILNNQGETCIATSRLFVEDKIREPFLEHLLHEAEKYVPGDPLDPATIMGPLVDRQHYENVLNFIASGQEEGARLLAGRSSSPSIDKGYFVTPTIFDQVQSNMRIAKEEIFGPVLAVDTFSCWQEAVEKANNSRFGLGAGIWTSNLSKAHKMSRELQVGMVWINNWGGGNATTPFGGVKQSGNGRDKSMHSLEKYTDLKTTWISLGS